MNEQPTLIRQQLARWIDAIDDEFVVALGPVLIRIMVVAQRFFAAASHAGSGVPIRV
jgi:hypothetical protein